MSGTYEAGGILKALSAVTDNSTIKQTENNEVLFNLFAVCDQKPKEDEKDTPQVTTKGEGHAINENGKVVENNSKKKKKKKSKKEGSVADGKDGNIKSAEDKSIKPGTDESIDENTKPGDNNESNEGEKKIKFEDNPERLKRTLFVGNVSVNVKKKALKKLFLQYGSIETIRFRSFFGTESKCLKKVTLIKKEFHQECKSLNAYIVFKEEDSVGKALVMNGTVLEGLHIRLDRVNNSGSSEAKNALFIGNLPYKITEEALHKHFEHCGEIVNTRVIRDKFTGMGKGFAYVAFKTREGVVFGMKLHKSNLEGREIRVSRANNNNNKTQPPRNSPVGRGGGGGGGPRGGGGVGRGGKNSFVGLKSTSRKDRDEGKKYVQGKQRTKKNALKRINQKNWKSTKKVEKPKSGGKT